MPPAIRLVLAIIAINAIGFGIVIPVTPAMVMELGGVDIAQATAIGGWLAFAYALSQFVFSPVMGNLSDRFGRRPVILVSLAGFAIDFLILAVAPNLIWVFVVRVIAGVFGATNAPAQALIADIVPPDQRARYYGLIGSAFAIGFIAGPAIGGLLGGFGHRVPFLVAAAMIGASAIYGWFSLPETLAPENRRKFEWRRANPVGALLQVRKLPGILPIAFVYLLWQLSTLVYPMTWSYFTIARYGWSTSLVGASLAGVGLTMVLVQILLLPRLVPRFGERGTATIGVVGSGLTMLALAAAGQGWMVFALLPTMALQALVHPNLTAMMTRRADRTTQGEVQGFASGVMALGSLAAPLIYNPLQARFSEVGADPYLPGIAYLVAGLFGLATLPVLLTMAKATRREGEPVTAAPPAP